MHDRFFEEIINQFDFFCSQINDIELIIITNRLTHSIVSDIQQFVRNHQIDRKVFDLAVAYLNDGDKNMDLSSELINIQYVPESNSIV